MQQHVFRILFYVRVLFPRLIAAVGGALHLVPSYCQYELSMTKNSSLPISITSLFLSVST